MSVARGFGLNGKSFYTNVCAPREVNLQFTVTPSNGLGITSLKSNGYVENVFMHTSTTPATGTGGFVNPNPANGYALIQLKQNFNIFLGMNCVFRTPTTGSTKIDNSAMTIGVVYIIATLGDATAAQWATVGVPAGQTPAVGLAFSAIATTAGTANASTSRVSTATSSGIVMSEVVGNADLATNSNISSNSGEWVYVKFSSATGTIAAPATASVCSMRLYFDSSTVTIDGL